MAEGATALTHTAVRRVGSRGWSRERRRCSNRGRTGNTSVGGWYVTGGAGLGGVVGVFAVEETYSCIGVRTATYLRRRGVRRGTVAAVCAGRSGRDHRGRHTGRRTDMELPAANSGVNPWRAPPTPLNLLPHRHTPWPPADKTTPGSQVSDYVRVTNRASTRGGGRGREMVWSREHGARARRFGLMHGLTFSSAWWRSYPPRRLSTSTVRGKTSSSATTRPFVRAGGTSRADSATPRSFHR